VEKYGLSSLLSRVNVFCLRTDYSRKCGKRDYVASSQVIALTDGEKLLYIISLGSSRVFRELVLRYELIARVVLLVP
jgi:hypothetical protein